MIKNKVRNASVKFIIKYIPSKLIIDLKKIVDIKYIYIFLNLIL